METSSKPPSRASTVPTYHSTRSHFFQAVSTAAAMGSPLSVPVYPDHWEPIVWRTHGFDGTPRTVVALGLGMYGYCRGAGDRVRGQLLLDLIRAEAALVLPQRRGDLRHLDDGIRAGSRDAERPRLVD